MDHRIYTYCVIFTILTHSILGETNIAEERVNKLSDQVRLILEHYKNPDPVGLPGVLIPDPMHIPDKTQDITFGITLKLLNTHVHGLSKFQIESINTNIGELKMFIAVRVDKLEVLGNYTLSSWLGFSRSKGGCNITMNDVYVEGLANLNVARLGNLEAEEIELDVYVNNFVLDFKNLSVMGSIFQRVMNSVGPFVLDLIRPTIMNTVNKNIRGDVNKKLRAMKQTFPNSIAPIDLAIAEGRKHVRKLGYDPYRVPDISHGTGIFHVEINQIWVNGLASFYRIGNITAALENHTIYIGLDVGTQRIKGMCQWDVSIASVISKSGSTAFSIDYFETSVRVSQSVDIRNKPQIEDIQLKLGNIQMHMDGIGTADYIIEFLVNFFPNLLRYQIMDTIEEPLKIKAQEIVDSIDFEKMVDDHLTELDQVASEKFENLGFNITVPQEVKEEEKNFLEEGLTVDTSQLDDEIL